MAMSEEEQRRVLSGVMGFPVDTMTQLTIARVCAESRMKFADELLEAMGTMDLDDFREHLRHERFLLASAAGLPTGYEAKVPR